MKQLLHKRDIIFLVIILFVAIAGLGFWFLMPGSSSNHAVITVDGEEYGTYPLDVDRVVEIKDDSGTVTNIVTIDNNVVYMSKANCPDHLCIEQGEQSRDGASIVCLPNKVVVTVSGNENEEEIDSIAK